MASSNSSEMVFIGRDWLLLLFGEMKVNSILVRKKCAQSKIEKIMAERKCRTEKIQTKDKFKRLNPRGKRQFKRFVEKTTTDGKNEI